MRIKIEVEKMPLKIKF